MAVGLILGYALFLLFITSMFFSAVNLITAWFILKKDKEYSTFQPKVSVVVRAWNDDAVVERCIKNLLEQDYPKDKLEIIIADDSTDNKTKEICEKYKEQIKYVKTEHKELKAEVIDPVIETAQGEVIAEKDVDGIAAKNWISEIVKPLQDNNIAGVTGPVFGGNWHKGLIARTRNTENIWHFCGGALGRYNLAKEGIMYGGNMAYKKSAWQEAGRHPKKTMVEDAEISMKFIEAGYKIAFARKAMMMQEEAETLSQYIEERKRWTTGDFAVWNKYAKTIEKNKLHRFLLMSNFSIDAWFFFSWVFLVFQPLFIIPLVTNLLALKMVLINYNLRWRFYFYTICYSIAGPVLQTIAIMAILKDRLARKKIRWTKVHHTGTELVWPINIKNKK